MVADEGQRQPNDEARTFERLGRIMPSATWLPIAIHVTWWGESLPTALLGAGESHDEPTGNEMQRLEAALQSIRVPDPTVSRTLIEGKAGPNERWNLSFLRRLFRDA